MADEALRVHWALLKMRLGVVLSLLDGHLGRDSAIVSDFVKANEFGEAYACLVAALEARGHRASDYVSAELAELGKLLGLETA